jgi:cardiolipin synthase
MSRADSVRRRAGQAVAGKPVPSRLRRLAWPAGIATAGLAYYSTESLRHRREDRDGYEILGEPGGSTEQLKAASEALTGSVAIEGNRVEVLINGDRIFPSVLEALREAKETINFETYVYWRGEIADELAALLCEKARDGVECRVLLDALGSAQMRPQLIREMREAGVEAVRFRPPKPYLVGRLSHRNHRRVLVVDGRVWFTGGVGIAAEWMGDAGDPDCWRYTHVRIEGPAVRSLQGAFAEHWVEATGEALVGERMLPEPPTFEDGIPVQIVRSGSRVGDTNVEVLYFLAISSAAESIDLTAAYFAPRPPFVKALCDAADRGVKVRILVPGSYIDKNFVRTAGRNVYDELLACGIELYEYCPTMLHAKTMVVDGTWSSVGTVNFDNRSFQLHDEITMCAFGDEPAGELTAAFEHDLTRSEPIDPGRWSERPLRQKLRERATKPLRREL